MSKSVVLDGQILHGVDHYGWWQVNKLDGWTAAPEAKSNDEERPLADGDYDTTVRYGSRLITIEGRLSAKSPEQAFLARERLTALLQETATFQVEEFGFRRWVNARRGQIRPGAIRGRLLPFTAEIRSNDSRKYGEGFTIPGGVSSPASLYQRGTAPAWPTILIAGASAGGYTLTLNGKAVTVTAPLVSGVSHTLDYRTGILRIGGAVYRGGISAANFSPILPGLPQNMTITGGNFSASYFDTYL